MRVFLIWFVAALLYMFEMLLRNSPGTMTTELMEHFSIGSTGLGFLTSSYYYSYVALQIPCGLIIDKFGPRQVIFLSALLSALGVYLFSVAEQFWVAQFSRFLLGAGSACVFIGCLKIASLWYPKEKFNVLCGLTNFMGTMGGMMSGFVLARSVQEVGFQQTTFFLSIICLGLAALVFLFVRNKKITNHGETPALLEGLSKVVVQRDMWIISVCNAIMYIPISGFVELWAAPFLRATYGMPLTQASSISVMAFLGSAIGSTFWPRLANRWKSYLKVLRLASLLTASSFFLITYHAPVGLVRLLFLLLGISLSGKILSFAWVNEKAGPKDSGVGIGFCNTITSLSGLIFQPLLGFVLDVFRDPELGYTAAAYQRAMTIIPVCLVICFVLTYFVREAFRCPREVCEFEA